MHRTHCTAAAYLSRMVISYSMSLRGVDSGSECSHKEMLALENKIAANAQCMHGLLVSAKAQSLSC